MDRVDRKLISELELNGRMTLKQLGDGVGFTSTGIKKRLDRLISRDIIKVSTLLNLETLNLQGAFLMLELESGTALQEFIDRFGKCPRIVQAFVTLGSFNLVLLLIAENTDTLESLAAGYCPLRAYPGIRRSEFYPISALPLSPYLPVREHLVGMNETSPCSRDCSVCSRFQNDRCVGCPATANYRGSL